MKTELGQWVDIVSIENIFKWIFTMSFTAGHKMGLFQAAGEEGIDPAMRWGNTITGCHPSIHPEGLFGTVKFTEAMQW